jgi:hypothetical protein
LNDEEYGLYSPPWKGVRGEDDDFMEFPTFEEKLPDITGLFDAEPRIRHDIRQGPTRTKELETPGHKGEVLIDTAVAAAVEDLLEC